MVGLTGQNANQRNVGRTDVLDATSPSEARPCTVRQRQIRLTESQIEELVEARQSGLTINRLAEQFGVHRTTVMRHLRSYS